MWTDNPLAWVIFKEHIPFLEIWDMQTCMCVRTLAREGCRQQLAMLFVQQSVDASPRDGGKLVVLPVVPMELQRVPNTGISSAAR